MKKPRLRLLFLFPVFIIFSISSFAANSTPFSDTTTTPLKGTYIKDGKLHLATGYKVSFSKDGKIGTISRLNGNGITGSYTCACPEEGSCSATIQGNTIRCNGDNCCLIKVTIDGDNLAIRENGNNDNIKWKILVIPRTTIKTTSN